MLDMGFIDQVVKIIKPLPKDRVTLLFSATMPPEIGNICGKYMRQPHTIEIESQTMTVDTTQQVYYRVEPNEKRTQLNRLLLLERPESCIIFCNTRMTVDRVQNFLARKGYAVQALHGDIAQNRRMKTMEQFKHGDFHLLVATDVAARGIHVDDLSLVINYDIPIEKDSYVHRIGRTGRAGHGGRAISLVTSDDIMSLYEIEEHIGSRIEEEDLPTEAVLNENRAEIDKWRQANAPQMQTPRPAATSTAKQGQAKNAGNSASIPKARQNQGKTASAANASQTQTKSTPTMNGRPSQAKSAPTTNGQQTQPKSAQLSNARQIPQRQENRSDQGRRINNAAPVAPPVQAKASPEAAPSQEAAPKKSLLQRLAQKIFGK
jgi:superfamily II DNA/RNA helicase